MPRFFIDRPIFAWVVSLFIIVAGLVAIRLLPIAQYPPVAPPTIVVTATYPGASAQTLEQAVISVIEQEINGSPGMIYTESIAQSNGVGSISISFQPGTNPDLAQVDVQNRLSRATPRLPQVVTQQGVRVEKARSNFLLFAILTSSDGSFTPVQLGDYASRNVLPEIQRIPGVGQAQLFGTEQAMRIWLDPQKLAGFNLSAADIAAAIRQQNAQVSSGAIGESPQVAGQSITATVVVGGQLATVDEFANIVLRAGTDGSTVRLRDVARVELNAQSFATAARLNGQPSTGIGVQLSPTGNALATADAVRARMAQLAAYFPPGMKWEIPYDSSRFIRISISQVVQTLFEAIVLVFLVMFLFLQNWRYTLIPTLVVPIALLGCFATLLGLGYSINVLTMFGMVLVIGIVVDDAIVVVENIERYLAEGLSPREAAHKTMDEVGSALVAIALVLAAVFVPTAFISGIAGQFYRQFALTIASATVISAIVSLTLSPALGALLLKPHDAHAKRHPLAVVVLLPFTLFARAFNAAFAGFANGYAAITRRLVRMTLVMMLIYAGLIVLTWKTFDSTPTGFIPQQDQGYIITVYRLPPGSSVMRTDKVVRRAASILLDMPDIAHCAGFAGFDGASRTNSPDAGAAFCPLAPYAERAKRGTIADTLRIAQQKLSVIQEAMAFVVPPPPVRGIGTGGGWKLYIEDRGGHGVNALEQVTSEFIARANQLPEVKSVFTTFNTATPKIFANIDRTRAEKLDVPAERVLDTLEIYLGSAYVNDFNFLGRTYRVTAQAEGNYRDDPSDLLKLKTRSNRGAMVPLGSLTTFRDLTGAYRVGRYNLYTAAEVQGVAAPGRSTGEALDAIEKLAAEVLPDGYGFEWTDLALQERMAGNTAAMAFGLGVAFVFLVLAALYESWMLPLAVILIVPMCLLASITGVGLRGMQNDILVQIGFIVLIGLAAKNAILIVEFARQAEASGLGRREAAMQAARMRLRPILMTSFSFIMGVVPLVIASGAGAEMRQSLGTAVFSGMLGVTFFGLLFTPVFYIVCRGLAQRGERRRRHLQENRGEWPT